MSINHISLGDLINISKGRKHELSIDNNNARRFIQIDDLRNDENIKYTRDQNATEVIKDDLIIAWDGANAGTIGYGLEGVIGSTLARLRIRKDNVSTPYLARFLKCNFINIRKNCTGATIPHISKNYLLKLKVPLPSLEIQKKIAAILEKADNLHKQCHQAEQELNALAQSVFLEMFGDPGFNSKKWSFVNFGDVIELLTDYHANGSYEDLKNNVSLFDRANYALMVRTTDLEKNDFVNDVKYISESAYNFLSKSKVYGGEIIINKIGSAGKVYLMPFLERPVSLGMNQFLIRINQELAESIYIYAFLDSRYGRKIIQDKVNGAVTKTITKNAVRNLKIPLPPIEMQIQFKSIYKKINMYIELTRQYLVEADALHDSLIQKAFKGDLCLNCTEMQPGIEVLVDDV